MENDSKEIAKKFEEKVREDLTSFLQYKKALDPHVPECPDVEEKWTMMEARKGLPKPASYTEVSADGAGIGIWNTDDPSFAPMIEAITPRIRNLLSGSPLLGGAQVTEIHAGVQKEYDDLDWNVLVLRAECDNGSVYCLTARMWYDPFSGEETETDYFMRGFRVWNDAYA